MSFTRSIGKLIDKVMWAFFDKFFSKVETLKATIYVLNPVIECERNEKYFKITGKYTIETNRFSISDNDDTDGIRADSSIRPILYVDDEHYITNAGYHIISNPVVYTSSHRYVKKILSILKKRDENYSYKYLFFYNPCGTKKLFNFDHDLIVSTNDSRKQKGLPVWVTFKDYLRYKERDGMQIVSLVPIKAVKSDKSCHRNNDSC